MPRLIADRPVLKMTSELGRVMAAARLREQSGATVYHLERGEPDFDTPAHIVEALAAAARAGETHYPDQRGALPLRQALVEKLARENGIRCEVDDVVITCGGTHGLFLAFQALLGEGAAAHVRPEEKQRQNKRQASEVIAGERGGGDAAQEVKCLLAEFDGTFAFLELFGRFHSRSSHLACQIVPS